jgi:hypothetical protein
MNEIITLQAKILTSLCIRNGKERDGLDFVIKQPANEHSSQLPMKSNITIT